jgi:hypothetical protein
MVRSRCSSSQAAAHRSTAASSSPVTRNSPFESSRVLNSMPCRTCGSTRPGPGVGSAGSPASSASGTRMAAAIAAAAVNGGCCSPASYRRIYRASTPAAFARSAWDIPSSVLRRRMASPRSIIPLIPAESTGATAITRTGCRTVSAPAARRTRAPQSISARVAPPSQRRCGHDGQPRGGCGRRDLNPRHPGPQRGGRNLHGRHGLAGSRAFLGAAEAARPIN